MNCLPTHGETAGRAYIFPTVSDRILFTPQAISVRNFIDRPCFRPAFARFIRLSAKTCRGPRSGLDALPPAVVEGTTARLVDRQSRRLRSAAALRRLSANHGHARHRPVAPARTRLMDRRRGPGRGAGRLSRRDAGNGHPIFMDRQQVRPAGRPVVLADGRPFYRPGFGVGFDPRKKLEAHLLRLFRNRLAPGRADFHGCAFHRPVLAGAGSRRRSVQTGRTRFFPKVDPTSLVLYSRHQSGPGGRAACYRRSSRRSFAAPAVWR